jgi:hypothetical protein
VLLASRHDLAARQRPGRAGVPALAHLVTLNPDGSPQVSLVWAGLDEDEIVAGHLPEHRKVRNIRHDSRGALSLETSTRNAMGLNEYLVIYGTTRRPDISLTSGWTGSRAWAPGPPSADTACPPAAG